MTIETFNKDTRNGVSRKIIDKLWNSKRNIRWSTEIIEDIKTFDNYNRRFEKQNQNS